MSSSFNIEEDDAKLIIHPNYAGTSLILDVEDDYQEDDYMGSYDPNYFG